MADVPKVNFSGLCGTGAPDFSAYVDLADWQNDPVTTAKYTITAIAKTKPGDTTTITFTVTDSVNEFGQPSLNYAISDTTTLAPGVYQHETIITSIADGTQYHALYGELTLRKKL